jgi:predicted Ser/Thr protein kinase
MLFAILDTATIDGGCNFSLKSGYGNPLGISNFRLREYAQYHQNYTVKKKAHERLVNDILTNEMLQESIDKSMKKTIAKNLIYQNQVFNDEGFFLIKLIWKLASQTNILNALQVWAGATLRN